MQRQRAAYHSKLHLKASLRNTPGFHTILGTVSTTPPSTPPPAPPSTPPPTRASLRDDLVETLESACHDANNRERVLRRASDLTYSASDNVKVFTSDARAARGALALARLRELTGMSQVNQTNVGARAVVAEGADEVRPSIFFRSKDVYASIRAAPKKAAGDISGWKNVHFQALCFTVCSPVLQHLTLLFESLARADPRFFLIKTTAFFARVSWCRFQNEAVLTSARLLFRTLSCRGRRTFSASVSRTPLFPF